MQHLFEQHVLGVVTNKPTCSLVNSPDNDLLYSHMGSIGHDMDLEPGSWHGKVC